MQGSPNCCSMHIQKLWYFQYVSNTLALLLFTSQLEQDLSSQYSAMKPKLDQGKTEMQCKKVIKRLETITSTFFLPHITYLLPSENPTVLPQSQEAFLSSAVNSSRSNWRKYFWAVFVATAYSSLTWRLNNCTISTVLALHSLQSTAEAEWNAG